MAMSIKVRAAFLKLVSSSCAAQGHKHTHPPPLAAGDNGSLTSVPVRDTKLGKADFVWHLVKVTHLPRLWGKYKDWVGEGKGSEGEGGREGGPQTSSREGAIEI